MGWQLGFTSYWHALWYWYFWLYWHFFLSPLLLYWHFLLNPVLTVLVCLTVLVYLTVLTFPTKIALTALAFLTERPFLLCWYADMCLTVLVFLTVLTFLNKLALTMRARSYCTGISYRSRFSCTDLSYCMSCWTRSKQGIENASPGVLIFDCGNAKTTVYFCDSNEVSKKQQYIVFSQWGYCSAK